MLNLTLNRTYVILIALAMAFAVVSCDDNSTGVEETELEVRMAKDIPANPEGESGGGPPAPINFTFYSLAEGEIVADEDSATTEWDIAFSSTFIIVNNGTSGPGQSGAVILDVPFEEVTTAPSEGYNIDTESQYAIPTGSGNGWYNYTGGNEPVRAVLPLPEKTIVVRTATGNYAKVDILSYYKGNPDTSTDEFANPDTRPPGRYYTFRYVIQTDGSRDLSASE